MVSKINATFKLDFVGIGCASAGTTWLYENLNKHPQICLAKQKELYYFCSKPQWGVVSYHSKGKDWLRSRFSHCKFNQEKGEITPIYIFDSTSPLLIKNSFSDIKLIISYRNPTDRLYSMYHMLARLYPIPDNFEDFLEQHSHYIETGYYYTLTRRFLEHFPKRQFHFISFDDIVKEPEKVIVELYKFLGVNHDLIPTDINKKINPTKVPRSILLRNIMGRTADFLKNSSWGIILNNYLDLFKIHELGRWIAQKNFMEATIPPMEQKTRDRLIDIYSQENLLLGKLISRDLSIWNK